MGRARRISTTGAGSGLAVEYVKSRRVLRLLGRLRGEELPPLEIPVDQLCDHLCIEPRQLGWPETYLLFAGVHGAPGGGLRDLVGTFPSEEEGRLAFSRVRQQHPSMRGWAELAAVDGFGRVRQVCWFGLAQKPPDTELPASSSSEVVTLRSRRHTMGGSVVVADGRPSNDVSSF